VWVTGGSGRGINQENPPMRIYIIGNDGIVLCRQPPATVTEGEIAVTSNEELHAAAGAITSATWLARAADRAWLCLSRTELRAWSHR
jgi:hypothetical protein